MMDQKQAGAVELPDAMKIRNTSNQPSA